MQPGYSLPTESERILPNAMLIMTFTWSNQHTSKASQLEPPPKISGWHIVDWQDPRVTNEAMAVGNIEELGILIWIRRFTCRFAMILWSTTNLHQHPMLTEILLYILFKTIISVSNIELFVFFNRLKVTTIILAIWVGSFSKAHYLQHSYCISTYGMLM